MFSAKNNEVRFYAPRKGRIFVSKSCCFIGSMEEWMPNSSEVYFRDFISALLFHLTFVKGVNTYYFPFEPEGNFPVNRILEAVRFLDYKVERNLILFKEDIMNIPFIFSGKNKFEKYTKVEKAPGDGILRLYQEAVDRSDYCFFGYDSRHVKKEVFLAKKYAIATGKAMRDLMTNEDFRELFRV